MTTAPATAPAQGTGRSRTPAMSTSSSSGPGSPASAPRITCGSSPRPDLRHPGRPGQPRRHLVDPPVPGRALRQRPVHLRLPVQAVARPVDRGGRGDPRLPRRGHRRGRPRPAHPLPAPGHGGQLVHRGPPVDRRGHPGRHRTAAAVHRRLPVDVPGLLQPRQALPAPVGGHGPLPGRDRAPAAVARGPRPGGQARRRDRLRRHGRDADPRDSRRRRST